MAFLFIVYSRMSFGWIKVNKKKDKPWWKRKEYKIPEEHFKVLKRPGKAAINRFQKNFAYHNSSQFRHWILGASILLAYITLGCVFAKTDKSSLNPWICGKNSILPKLFCLASNEKIAHSLIMTRGIKLRKYFGSINSRFWQFDLFSGSASRSSGGYRHIIGSRFSILDSFVFFGEIVDSYAFYGSVDEFAAKQVASEK